MEKIVCSIVSAGIRLSYFPGTSPSTRSAFRAPRSAFLVELLPHPAERRERLDRRQPVGVDLAQTVEHRVFDDMEQLELPAAFAGGRSRGDGRFAVLVGVVGFERVEDHAGATDDGGGDPRQARDVDAVAL